MLVQLGCEVLNLDHVARVRSGTGWKNGQEELTAEVDGLSPRGDLQVLVRYRGVEAQKLRAILLRRCARLAADAPSAAETVEAPLEMSHPSRNTLADVKLPL